MPFRLFGRNFARAFSVWPHSYTIARTKALIQPMMTNSKQMALLALQHALETTGSMYDNLGIPFEQIMHVGKIYSNSSSVIAKMESQNIICVPNTALKNITDYEENITYDAKQALEQFKNMLKEKCLNKVIVLCDGANILNMISREQLSNELGYPVYVVGIEQTTYGIQKLVQKQFDFPVIQVAQSAAKTLLESYLIAETVVNKIKQRGYLARFPLPTIGVVGRGSIGNKIVQILLQQGITPNVFEIDELKCPVNGVKYMPHMQDLILNSDIIIGCTYADVTKYLDFDNLFSMMRSNKIFINAASNDAPFRTLLKKLFSQKKIAQDIIDPFKDQIFEICADKKIIMRPFTINFDDSGVSVAHNKIALTRALLMLAVGQSALLLNDYPEYETLSGLFIKLSPEGQKQIIDAWIQENPEQIDLQPIVKECDISYLEKYSLGIDYYHPLLVNNEISKKGVIPFY